jgi:hypothetical protein
MRPVFASATFLICISILIAPVFAQSRNPVPYLHDPLLPGAAAPGAAALTLTVNGAGFVNGAQVLWNGVALSTTYVSRGQLTAVVPASALQSAATIPVTVANPAPGGGSSNAVLFEITVPSTAPSFTRTDSNFPALGNPQVNAPGGLAVSYVSGSAVPLLLIADQKCPTTLSCTSSQGAIAVAGESPMALVYTAANPESIVTGDFSGDGLTDMITLGNALAVSLAAAPGVFHSPSVLALPPGVLSASEPAVGDFNGDGNLDLALAANNGFYFLPGNGDGTFGTPVFTPTDPSSIGTYVAVGDFNGDGILDVAVSNFELAGGSVSIYIGNGDGTFLLQSTIPFTSMPGQIAAADFNGDGKLDLAVLDSLSTEYAIAILLGKGDGTFQPKTDSPPAGVSPLTFALGDYDGSGRVSVAVSDTLCTPSGCPASGNGAVNVLVGNGDGTLQTPLTLAASGLPGALVTAEFADSGPTNYFATPIGRAGFAVTDYAGNSISIFSAVPGTITNPLPSIASISPGTATEGGAAFTLTVSGSNFVSGATASFAGASEPTTFVSSTELTAAIPATALAAAGSAAIVVTNPPGAGGSGGGNSVAYPFTIYLPPPTITFINPTSVAAGSVAFTLTVYGANLVPESVLNVNGATEPVTFGSASQVTANISAAAIASPGTLNLSITNPVGGVDYAGGGTSSTVTLTVTLASTQPTISALSPASITAGSSGFPLTLSGSGFASNSTVMFGSVPLVPISQSPTALTVSVPASDVSLAGWPLVYVQNSSGTASVPTTFTVNNPIPALASLSPQTIAPGSADHPLSVGGSNFNPSSKIQINGTPLPTSFVSATSLSAQIPAGYFVNSGNSNLVLSVTVVNPSPGGGATSALPIVVPDFNLSAPSATSLVVAGQPGSFTLAVAASALSGTLGSAISFSASPLPKNATATFSPSPLPAGSKGQNVTLSISTMPHTAAVPSHDPRNYAPFAVAVLTIFLAVMILSLKSRAAGIFGRRYAPQLLAMLLLTIAAGLAACGSAPASPQLNPNTGTPAGNYQITVTANSGGASLTTQVSLTVQ